LKPLFYPGNITVEVRAEFVKNTSFGLHHRVLNEHGEVCAEANDVIVMFDFKKNEKVVISDSFRASMLIGC
jgi:acyl-CoA thioester hydrolase